MPAPGFSSAAESLLGHIRQYLGLSQQAMAHYLGTSRVRVADYEADRRALPYAASSRLTYLHLLLPTAWKLDLAPLPQPVLPPWLPLPVAPPPAPWSPTLEKTLRYQHRLAAQRARVLRLRLETKRAETAARAHAHPHQVALLAAFAAPPAAAVELRLLVPDPDSEATSDWLMEIAIQVRQRGRVLTSALTAQARDELKLYLLEAEAATLAVWLGVAGGE
ncbi:MAG: hypothetical protein H7330_01695 [Hymenobacteraceae bacterium]|nr:hypothetical protein [Hymenobacteraceae bacterium]